VTRYDITDNIAKDFKMR